MADQRDQAADSSAESDEPSQFALPLRVERRHDDAPLIPARILNEYVYCPRLAYLEWVQKEWQESADTVHGRHVHRRVDKASGRLPEPDDLEQPADKVRSVELSSKKLDLVACTNQL